MEPTPNPNLPTQVMNWIVGWVRASWKAIMPILLLGLYELGLAVITALQDTWVDQPVILAGLTALAVWFKKNQPNP